MFSRVRMSEDKVRTKDPCWYVGTIYDPRELIGVSTVGPRLDEVLHLAYDNLAIVVVSYTHRHMCILLLLLFYCIQFIGTCVFCRQTNRCLSPHQ